MASLALPSSLVSEHTEMWLKAEDAGDSLSPRINSAGLHVPGRPLGLRVDMRRQKCPLKAADLWSLLF